MNRNESRKAALARYVQRLRGQLKWVELPTLLLVALVMGGVWMFAEVAESVSEDETHQLDETILLAMRNPGNPSDPVGPRWLEELGRDFTAFGGIGVLVLLALATAGYLVLMSRRRVALLVLTAVSGGLLLSTLFKEGFDRPRPDLVPHGSYVYTTSFPSGHSMMSAATYLTLGALLARIHKRRAVKVYFLTLATLLTISVGISRVYLGVHWPTDVLAGWSAGAVWAVLCWLAALWFQHRGAVEEHLDEQAQGPASSPV